MILVFQAVFLQRVCPQIRRSYYLWFYYLIFNYMYVLVFDRRFWEKYWCLTVAEYWCLTVENSPNPQRSVDNPKNGPQKRSKPLCGLAG